MFEIAFCAYTRLRCRFSNVMIAHEGTHFMILFHFRFPMFTAVHKICLGEMPVAQFIDCLKNHPEHM